MNLHVLTSPFDYRAISASNKAANCRWISASFFTWNLFHQWLKIPNFTIFNIITYSSSGPLVIRVLDQNISFVAGLVGNVKYFRGHYEISKTIVVFNGLYMVSHVNKLLMHQLMFCVSSHIYSVCCVPAELLVS